jgi:exopolysaccharide production protein ExoZ
MADDRKLEWLEAMRGLAAMWVLLHHAGQAVDHFIGDSGAQRWIERGYLGVDFFFVLSGFIIAFAAHRLAERGGGVRDYLTARLVRIYVPYLPVGIGMLLLFLLVPGMSAEARETSVLTSLTLLPDNQPPALSVAWTLVHELIFYAIYALWFVHRRVFRVVMVAWAGAILHVWMTETRLPPAAAYFLAPVNLCFFVGVATYHLSRRIRLRAWAVLAAGLAGSVLAGSQAIADTPQHIVLVAGFGLLVIAGTSAAASRWSVWPPLVTLGAASYAVYLVHNPVLSVAVRGVGAVLPALQAWPAFFLIATVATCAGLAYWRWYEVPMLAWVRSRLSPKAGRQAAPSRA